MECDHNEIEYIEKDCLVNILNSLKKYIEDEIRATDSYTNSIKRLRKDYFRDEMKGYYKGVQNFGNKIINEWIDDVLSKL